MRTYILVFHSIYVLATLFIDVQHNAAKNLIVCLVQLFQQTVQKLEVVPVLIYFHFAFPFLELMIIVSGVILTQISRISQIFFIGNKLP